MLKRFTSIKSIHNTKPQNYIQSKVLVLALCSYEVLFQPVVRNDHCISKKRQIQNDSGGGGGGNKNHCSCAVGIFPEKKH